MYPFMSRHGGNLDSINLVVSMEYKVPDIRENCSSKGTSEGPLTLGSKPRKKCP
jgi:hypothetical protein